MLLSRNVARIEEDHDPELEPLISLPFGHAKLCYCLSISISCVGSQSLLNLVLCGVAAPNPWDGAKDTAGVGKNCTLYFSLCDFDTVLHGIPRRNDIGYLTMLEALSYTACGSYFKNPKFGHGFSFSSIVYSYPIWVLGSESHFTVLFR